MANLSIGGGGGGGLPPRRPIGPGGAGQHRPPAAAAAASSTEDASAAAASSASRGAKRLHGGTDAVAARAAAAAEARALTDSSAVSGAVGAAAAALGPAGLRGNANPSMLADLGRAVESRDSSPAAAAVASLHRPLSPAGSASTGGSADGAAAASDEGPQKRAKLETATNPASSPVSGASAAAAGGAAPPPPPPPPPPIVAAAAAAAAAAPAPTAEAVEALLGEIRADIDQNKGAAAAAKATRLAQINMSGFSTAALNTIARVTEEVREAFDGAGELSDAHPSIGNNLGDVSNKVLLLILPRVEASRYPNANFRSFEKEGPCVMGDGATLYRSPETRITYFEDEDCTRPANMAAYVGANATGGSYAYDKAKYPANVQLIDPNTLRDGVRPDVRTESSASVNGHGDRIRDLMNGMQNSSILEPVKLDANGRPSDGNHTIMAAIELGIQVPVVRR